MAYKYTTESYISLAKTVHGDKYTYDNFEYKGITAKGVFTCKIHGDFLQPNQTHIIGRGCRKCGTIKTSAAKFKGTDKFIKEAKEIHNDKYEYNEVDYKSSTTNVIITCKVHGNFKQTPDSHIQGSGCSKCANLQVSKALSHNKEKFVELAKELHGDAREICELERELQQLNKTTKYIPNIDFKGKYECFSTIKYENVK